MIHMHGGPKDEDEWKRAEQLHKNIYEEWLEMRKVIIKQSN